MKQYELDPTEENIFRTISQDALRRNQKLVVLGKMLLQQKKHFFFSLDGCWGSGKSFFVKQLQYCITHVDTFRDNSIFVEEDKQIFQKLQEKYLVLYYNAWENDTHVDPLESLIYKVLDEFEKQKRELFSFAEYKKIVKGMFENVIKVGTGGIVDLEQVDKMNSFEDMTSAIITSEEKRNAFYSLLDQLLERDQRIFLIVDELDRCNPKFAVQMLETLKHFWNYSKITICVVTNNQELACTIKHFYGNDFDGIGYLHKFYDVVLDLDDVHLLSYLTNFCHLSSEFSVPDEIRIFLMQYYHFSLRDCNQFLSIMDLLDSTYLLPDSYSTKQYFFKYFFLPLTIAFKIKRPDLYEKFIHKQGEKILLDILAFLDNNTHSLALTFSHMIQNENMNYHLYFRNIYRSIFDETSEFYVLFSETISLLGNCIHIY